MLPQSMGSGPILSLLKRLFHPLRPVLLPLWRPIRPIVQPPRPKLAPGTEWQKADRRWRRLFRLRHAPIRTLGRREFESLALRFPYYRARGRYLSAACAIAEELIDRHRLRSALELGPHVRSIVVGADVMDLEAQAQLEVERRVVVHDAREIPWPFPDRQYDLFVALQVFEHLGDRQNAAFQEVCRVARHAVISLPIDWAMTDPTDIHHGITHERAMSWFQPVTPSRIEIGDPPPKSRVIYVFENLPAQLPVDSMIPEPSERRRRRRPSARPARPSQA
jgi:SAM-dependent methyltransferase